MNIVITGGSGFLGRRLADTLLERGVLSGPMATTRPSDRITLIEHGDGAGLTDRRIQQITGDVADRRCSSAPIDTETDVDLSPRGDGERQARSRLRSRHARQPRRVPPPAGGVPPARHHPRVVFTSSVAVYGGELPATVPDSLAVTPQTWYGTQKAMAELLINDYTRRGFVDGRALRLPTISVRPGRPNAAASSFASGIIREPLNGETSLCPVSAGTAVWLLSPRTVTECFIAAHDIDGAALGSNRLLNLPGMSITVGEMVAALERVAGPDVVARIRLEPDPRIEQMVATWPGELDATRARKLGFPTDANFDDHPRFMADAHIGAPQ